MAGSWSLAIVEQTQGKHCCWRFLHGSIYSFPLVRSSCPLSAGVLHALLYLACIPDVSMERDGLHIHLLLHHLVLPFLPPFLIRELSTWQLETSLCFKRRTGPICKVNNFSSYLTLKHFIQPLFSMENKHSVMNMESSVSVLLLMKLDWHFLEIDSNIKMLFIECSLELVEFVGSEDASEYLITLIMRQTKSRTVLKIKENCYVSKMITVWYWT